MFSSAPLSITSSDEKFTCVKVMLVTYPIMFELEECIWILTRDSSPETRVLLVSQGEDSLSQTLKGRPI